MMSAMDRWINKRMYLATNDDLCHATPLWFCTMTNSMTMECIKELVGDDAMRILMC